MIISDFHNDYLTSNNAYSKIMEYSNKNHTVVGAIFRGQRTFSQANSIAESFSNNGLGNNLKLAFEDFGYASVLEMERLLNFNPVYVGLTWNNENCLGYGCDYNKGLKKLGVKAISMCNEREIFVDLAHSSDKGFYDIIDNADYVVNSHTCFSEVFSHKRNINREKISLIIEKGGLIGLCLYSDFISGKKKCKVQEIFRHIDYFVQRFGYKNLCIGSDYYGGNDICPKLKQYTDWDILKNLMIKNGYKQKVVDGILHDNLNNLIC